MSSLTERRAPLHAWLCALECGIDHTGRLERFGVRLDKLGRPDREAARAAWSRYGPAILANRHPRLLPPWGQLQWGTPWLDQDRAA